MSRALIRTLVDRVVGKKRPRVTNALVQKVVKVFVNIVAEDLRDQGRFRYDMFGTFTVSQDEIVFVPSRTFRDDVFGIGGFDGGGGSGEDGYSSYGDSQVRAHGYFSSDHEGGEISAKSTSDNPYDLSVQSVRSTASDDNTIDIHTEDELQT